MGNLYVVSTPIGNLKDITLMAVDVLNEVNLVLTEDTRRSGLLLKHLSIKKRMMSFHEHNEDNKQEEVIQKLKKGENIALISDSGTPTIADPGFKLVRECTQDGISVISIPGPSAILAGLTVSGLPTDSFSFLGYLPKKEGKRREFYGKILALTGNIKTTVIFFDTPHRIQKTLEDLTALAPDYSIVIARELTKLNEEVIRGKVRDVMHKTKGRNLKGELTILLHK
jgi:16S rRNA (cytidine1402-2'-O)-methyltransferase